jgi:hypothetical protein
MSNRAFTLTAEAGMKDDTVVARFKLFQDTMMAEVEKNCRNISILMAKHATFCKALYESPLSRGKELFRQELRR